MTGAPATRNRAEALAQLAAEPLDVLVIGGGVVGAGVAWPLARAGLRVAVVDANDLAGATSSSSSKLVHGGLRYLAMRDVRLVREAHAERRANATVVAPHLVRPLPFLVPLTPETSYGAAALLAGTALYGALSGFRDGPPGSSAPTPRARSCRCSPPTASGAPFSTTTTSPTTRGSRSAVLDGAAEAGALVLNHVEVVGLQTLGGRVTGADAVDRLTGAARRGARPRRGERGRAVDRPRPAAGAARRRDDGAAVSRHAPHALHRRRLAGRGHRDARRRPRGVRGAVEDGLLLGTTDHPYDGDPADIAPDPGRRAPDPGRGGALARGGGDRPEPDPAAVRRPPRAAGRGRPDQRRRRARWC